jgi:hypothetical protein
LELWLELQRRLIVHSQAGLCNRLRALLSGRAIALATEREFAMLWKPSAACGCAFEHLFENDWNVHSNVFFDTRRALDLPTTPWNSYPDWFTLSEPTLYVYHHSWLIQPTRFAHHSPLELRCQEWLRELEPIAPIARRIKEFQENLFRPTMIGVHLRRGDMTQTRPDTTANLAAAMRQIDAWLETAGDAGIFLCTDDGASNPYSGQAVPGENVTTQFVQRYGSRVVFTRPSSLDRRSPEAIQDALVDLWLVRMTDYFVGTAGSSFSEMAVFGRSIPAVQTAGSTARYQRQAHWLKRVGVYDWLARKGLYEFGRDVPYTYVRARYLRRLRLFLKKFQ